MKLPKTVLPILAAVAAFAVPLGFNQSSAFAMPVSFGLSVVWVSLSFYALGRWSAYLPALLASAPFALFWPVLGLLADMSCRWGGDCL